MKLRMVDGNIFNDEYIDYHKVQCISLDCRMGMGIAESFTRRYPLMRQECRNVINENNLHVPIVLKHNDVFNLITKDHYWELPTYTNMERCIMQLVQMCKEYNVKKLAMPKIGCNLDKLSWKIVKGLIEYHFEGIDIDIIVFKGRKRNV